MLATELMAKTTNQFYQADPSLPEDVTNETVKKFLEKRIPKQEFAGSSFKIGTWEARMVGSERPEIRTTKAHQQTLTFEVDGSKTALWQKDDNALVDGCPPTEMVSSHASKTMHGLLNSVTQVTQALGMPDLSPENAEISLHMARDSLQTTNSSGLTLSEKMKASLEWQDQHGKWRKIKFSALRILELVRDFDQNRFESIRIQFLFPDRITPTNQRCICISLVTEPKLFPEYGLSGPKTMTFRVFIAFTSIQAISIVNQGPNQKLVINLLRKPTYDMKINAKKPPNLELEPDDNPFIPRKVREHVVLDASDLLDLQVIF